MRTPTKKDDIDQQKAQPKRKAGRPPKEIDLDLLKQLAGMQCTDQEIAAVLNVSHDTLLRRKQSDTAFVEAMEAGRASGRASLRRLQWQAAQKGNPAMLIFLGKNILKQRDKFEDEDASSNDPLPWVD